MESDAAVTATGDDGCEHLAIEPEDGDSWATTRTSSCSTWLTMVQAVARGMRTVVRLAMDSHLRSMLRLSLSVLVRDLSEGRPDCRRLAPAVFKLAEVRLTATSQSRAAPTSSTPSRTSSPECHAICITTEPLSARQLIIRSARSDGPSAAVATFALRPNATRGCH